MGNTLTLLFNCFVSAFVMINRVAQTNIYSGFAKRQLRRGKLVGAHLRYKDLINLCHDSVHENPLVHITSGKALTFKINHFMVGNVDQNIIISQGESAVKKLRTLFTYQRLIT